MKRLLLLLCWSICLCWQCGRPEGKVQRPAYERMLNLLLSDAVPQVTVARYDSLSPAVLLDARSREEYEVSHLPGARWVGYESFDSSAVANLPRDTSLLVYCAVGYRSEKIGQRLQAMGFAEVQNLYGGIFEWVNQGHPVVNPGGQPTDSVHGYSKAWGRWVDSAKVVY
jgi:rhodanese-related sulfurtransferase